MIQLQCLSCRDLESIGQLEVIRRLRAGGKLRRDADPDSAIVLQLALVSAPEWSCRSCGEVGLIAKEHALEGDDSWGGSTLCSVCREPIPVARLEIFPDATSCAHCQTKEDSGESTDEAEYCPRCGCVMELRKSNRGITRFELSCPGCRR